MLERATILGTDILSRFKHKIEPPRSLESEAEEAEESGDPMDEDLRGAADVDAASGREGDSMDEGHVPSAEESISFDPPQYKGWWTVAVRDDKEEDDESLDEYIRELS